MTLEAVQAFASTESIVKELYIAFPLLAKENVLLATALDSHEVLFRSLTLPISSRSKAIAALPFQLEAVLPFPIEEAVIESSLTSMGKKAFTLKGIEVFGLGKRKGSLSVEERVGLDGGKTQHPPSSQYQVNLFATRDRTLQAHLDQWQSLGIDPDLVTTTPNALNRLARWIFPQEEQIHLMYIGESKSCCVISNKDQILMTQTLYFGHLDFLNALAKDFPHRSLDELKSLVRKSEQISSEGNPLIAFNQINLKIGQEIERLFLYLKDKNFLKHSQWILLGDKYPAFPYKTHFPEVKTHFSNSLQKDSLAVHEYALPMGIALDAHCSDSQAVQFRKSKWASLRCQMKRKNLSFRLLLFCITASLLMGVGGHLLLKKKEREILSQLSQCLPAALAQAALESTENLSELFWEWEQSLNKQKLPFPFLPTTPSVSDVLAWLSTHPALSTPEGGRKEGIEVQGIRYQLYQYPKLGESGGVYAAKVDLELIADTPRLAREFHDALLKGDSIVNGKKEIKWNVQQNTYWVSFELNPLPKGRP